MSVTSTPKTVAHRDTGFLNLGISASDTTLTISPIYKTVNGIRTKQGIDSLSGFAELTQGNLFELISFDSVSVDATTKISTLTGVRRGLSVNSTTQSLTAGTGRAWAKNASFSVVNSANYIQATAFLDKANTFNALQTMSAGLTLTGTTSTITVPSMTTTQRDAIVSPANGMIIYNSTTGVMNQYIGGAWTTFATGTIANAANASSGKVDIATAAEVAAGTATDATSGALNVIPVSIVKTTSTGAVNGSVPALNAAVAVDVSIGGTGKVSPTSGALLVGAGASAMTLIGPGTAGQVPVSDGTTLVMGTAATFYKPISTVVTDSATLTNPTISTAYDTHTHTIPTNTLIAGTWYEAECTVTVTHGVSNSFDLHVRLAGAAVHQLIFPVQTGTAIYHLKARIEGTAASGASVAVRVSYHGQKAEATGGAGAATYISTNQVTNGAIALAFGASFTPGNAGNNTKAVMSSLTRHSLTAF